MTNKEIGYFGEEMTCRYLQRYGCKILARNFTLKGGEIDIIAQINDYIAFVEVKTRKADSLTSGFDAINTKKKRSIIFTAEKYYHESGSCLQPRFDVSIVTIDGKKFKVDYYKNAFDTAGFNIRF